MKKILFMLMVSAALCAGCDDNEHRWQARAPEMITSADDSCRPFTSWCRDDMTWYVCTVGDEVEFVPGICFE